MLDPRLFRTDIELIKQQLARRAFEFDSAAYEELEAKRKEIQIKTQELQNERNTRSKSIGQRRRHSTVIESDPPFG